MRERKLLEFTLRDPIPSIVESWMQPRYRLFSDARKQASSLTYNAFLTYVMWMCPMPEYEHTMNKNGRDILTFLLRVQKKVKDKNLRLSQIYNFGADYDSRLRDELVKNHGYTYDYLDDIYVSVLYDLFIVFLNEMMVLISKRTLKRNIGKIRKGEKRDASQVDITREDIIPLLEQSKKDYLESIKEINS